MVDSWEVYLLETVHIYPLPNLPPCLPRRLYGMLRLGATDPSLSMAWLDTTAAHFAPLKRWNLTSGMSDIPAAPAHAAAYQWNADGTLAPFSPPEQSVGAPDGGRSFTVWQPGNLQFGTKSDQSSQAATVVPQDVAWVSATSPVSPDGSHVLVAEGCMAPSPSGGPVRSWDWDEQAQRTTGQTPGPPFSNDLNRSECVPPC